MKLDLGLVCDYGQADPSGKIHIIGVFRYIHTAQVPATHPSMSLVLRIIGFKSEGKKHQIEIRLVDADGDPVPGVAMKGEIQFADIGPASTAMIQSQAVINLMGVTFPTAGDYHFDILIDEHHIGGIPLHVHLVASGT